MKIEKIVFVGGNVVPYDPSSDCHRLTTKKFLVRKDGLVIVGPGRDGHGASHKALAENYRYYTGEVITSDDLIGAGDAYNGEITGWRSTGFRVQTPEDLKLALLEAIGLPQVRWPR